MKALLIMIFASFFGSLQASGKTVGVFCSADETIPESFKTSAFELGSSLAREGFGLVTGGSNSGLMKSTMNGFAEVADPRAARGVMPSVLKEYKVHHPQIPEENFVWTNTMYERLETFHTLCSTVVVLPGGFGTLHELMDFLVPKQWGLMKKKIVLFNVDHYWDPLLAQFKLMVEKNALKQRHLDLLTVVTSLDECIAALKEDAEASPHQGLNDRYWEEKKP